MWNDLNDLPDPAKDPMPSRVTISQGGIERRKAVKKEESQYLDPKNDTEARVKYLLESKLFGATLRKDGDWVTVPGGREVYQKKISDFVGGITFPGEDHQRLLYVEVKGVSPRNNFNLSRLDKSNRKGQKSQHEKLQEVFDAGAFVLVAIGWWDALPGKRPVIVEKKGREYTYWKKKDLVLTVTLTRWDMWINFVLPMLKERYGDRRSIPNKPRDKEFFFMEDRVTKFGNRWQLSPQHWWKAWGIASRSNRSS